MRSWIRRIGRGFSNLRDPLRISDGAGIVIRVGGADGGHGPPKVVRVLGVVEGDHAVGERQVQQRK